MPGVGHFEDFPKVYQRTLPIFKVQQEQQEEQGDGEGGGGDGLPDDG